MPSASMLQVNARSAGFQAPQGATWNDRSAALGFHPDKAADDVSYHEGSLSLTLKKNGEDLMLQVLDTTPNDSRQFPSL